MKIVSSRPSSRPGRWAVWLLTAFAVMFFINSFIFMPTSSDAPWRHVILPYYGIAMLVCGLAAGIVGLVAVTRGRERSWLVWLAILPMAWVIFMLFGEFLLPLIIPGTAH